MYTPDASKIYLGSQSLSKVMLGATQVWPKSSCIKTVEWIKGSGNSELSGNYNIEFPFKTSSTLSFRFRGKLLGYTGGQLIGGAYTADTFDYRWFVPGNNIQYLDIGNSRISKIMIMWSDRLLDYKIGNIYVYDNLTQSYIMRGTPVETVPSTNPLRLRIPLLEVEAFQAWEDDTLIFDGLPAYNECEDKYGIYDSLGGGFYTSEEDIVGPA